LWEKGWVRIPWILRTSSLKGEAMEMPGPELNSGGDVTIPFQDHKLVAVTCHVLYLGSQSPIRKSDCTLQENSPRMCAVSCGWQQDISESLEFLGPAA
jgi:hypothetical protein